MERKMEFGMLPSPFDHQTQDQTPPAAACYSISMRRERENANKENIAISHKNSAMLMMDNDDEKKLTPHRSHRAPMPSAVAHPPCCSNMNASLVRGSSQDPLKLSGERSTGFMAASSHDSPPKLSFKRFSSVNAKAEFRRPVALRPSTMEPPQSSALRHGAFPRGSATNQARPFPSLDMIIDIGTDDDALQNPARAATSSSQDHEPISFPQLSIRPVASKKEVKLSSPLARRGASERAYLQGQVRAEALRRRKQEQHNEERKHRENANRSPVVGFKDDDTSDANVLSMIEKFKFGFGEKGPPPNDGANLKSIQKEKGLSDFASSPPLILKKSFKRSVSAVLEDSGINEDGNLLFFPDGVPLLKDDEDESPLGEGADRKSGNESQDSAQDKGSSSGADEKSVEASEHESIVQESSSSDELSPSLIAADVIWQLGAVSFDYVPGDISMPTKKGNKKVTLRPKMNAPKHNITCRVPHPSRESEPTNASEGSDSFSSESDALSKNIGKANACLCHDGLIPDGDELKNPFEFKSPDKAYPSNGDIMGASESFQQLSFENEDRTEHKDHEECYKHEGNGDSAHSFVFSSPDARSNYQVSKANAPPETLLSGFVLKDPHLFDSNFRTPDNSYSDRRPSRMSIKGKASMALDTTIEEGNALMSCLSLKPPVSEANYRYSTPDTSEHKRSCRRHLPAMPKLPELSMPDMLFQGAATLAVDATAKEDHAFSPETEINGFLLKEPLSESNYCTPDNAYSNRIPVFNRQLGEQIPKMPTLDSGTQAQTEEDNTHKRLGQPCIPHSEDQDEELSYQHPMQTPC